jgi:hypothetical protein
MPDSGVSGTPARHIWIWITQSQRLCRVPTTRSAAPRLSDTPHRSWAAQPTLCPLILRPGVRRRALSGGKHLHSAGCREPLRSESRIRASRKRPAGGRLQLHPLPIVKVRGPIRGGTPAAGAPETRGRAAAHHRQDLRRAGRVESGRGTERQSPCRIHQLSLGRRVERKQSCLVIWNLIFFT